MSKKALIHPDPLLMAVRKALRSTEPRMLPTETRLSPYGSSDCWVCPYCDHLVYKKGGKKQLGSYNMHFALNHGTPFWKELHLIEVISNRTSMTDTQLRKRSDNPLNQPTPDRAEVVEAAITALLVDGSSIYWGGKAYRITEIKKSTALAVTDIRTVLKNIVLASNFTKQANQKVDELVQFFTAAVETVKPKKVPAGPVDTSDDAINSIPWETGWNNCVDEFDQRFAEMVGKTKEGESK